MEHLKIKTNYFRVMMTEKTKLYNMYGKQYKEKLPEIYEKLASILNSDNFFTETVERRLYEKEYQESALKELMFYLLTKLYNFEDDVLNEIKNSKDINEITEKNFLENISTILGDANQTFYFDILYSITKRLFNNYVGYLLQLYVRSKEPALSNCRGVKDISQCDFIIERYHHFIDSLNIDATPLQPTINENGCIVINKGDLFHGTRYSEKVIESIANRGLESGQLHGIEEDGETFCCIDFFKAPKDLTPDEVCAYGKQYTNGDNQIVFVVSRLNLEGPEAMFPDLTDYDAYNEATEKGKKAREIVNVAGLPLNYSNGAAILMGVPPCMISSIIINSEIENDFKKIDFLSSHFPKATIISRANGVVIKNPTVSYKR